LEEGPSQLKKSRATFFRSVTLLLSGSCVCMSIDQRSGALLKVLHLTSKL
jgi:hypothetical protein